MARIRSVKPEFWTDRKLSRLSRDARLLYIALWNQADEWSRVHGDTRYVKGHCLPYDDDLTLSAVDRLLAELSAAGHLQRYDVGGDPYLYLPKMAKHQRLEPHKVPSRLPDPPSVQVTDVQSNGAEKSERGADLSARDSDVCEPDANPSEPIVVQQVAGSRWQVAGGREQEAPPAAGTTLALIPSTAPGAAGVVQAYVDACREIGQVVDNRAKGRIAKESAALLQDGAPQALLIAASRRLASNGFADIGAEARRLHAESQPQQAKPSTTDTRVAATLARAQQLRAQETG